MNKQKIAIGVVAFIAMLALSGCGPNVGEKIMEKAIESQTGGKVNVNANNGEMTIKSKEGDISASGTGSATLSADFPKDIYIAPDAQIMVSLANGQNKSYSAVYTTGMTASEIYAKYQEDLALKGWAIEPQTEINTGDAKMIQYKKGTSRLNLIVGLSQDKSKTHVQLTGAEN
ncbi:MAG: hypothetical protein WAV73_01615 [Candidatus Moraniibacteriota bacterium]